jgi:hypothetical protein
MPESNFVVLPHPYVHVTKRITGQARDSEFAWLGHGPNIVWKAAGQRPKCSKFYTFSLRYPHDQFTDVIHFAFLVYIAPFCPRHIRCLSPIPLSPTHDNHFKEDDKGELTNFIT